MIFQHVHRFLILNKNVTLFDLMKEFKVSLNQLVVFLSKVEKESDKKLIKRHFVIFAKNKKTINLCPSNLLIQYSFYFNEKFNLNDSKNKIKKGEQYLLMHLKHGLTINQIRKTYKLKSNGTIYNAIRDIWDISLICKEIKNGERKKFHK